MSVCLSSVQCLSILFWEVLALWLLLLSGCEWLSLMSPKCCRQSGWQRSKCNPASQQPLLASFVFPRSSGDFVVPQSWGRRPRRGVGVNAQGCSSSPGPLSRHDKWPGLDGPVLGHEASSNCPRPVKDCRPSWKPVPHGCCLRHGALVLCRPVAGMRCFCRTLWHPRLFLSRSEESRTAALLVCPVGG